MSIRECRVDNELCLPGLVCPQPILEAKRALRALEGGQKLRVLSTDKHSVADFATFCAQTQHTLCEQAEETIDGTLYYITIIAKRI